MLAGHIQHMTGQRSSSKQLVDGLTSQTLTKLIETGVVIDEDDPVLEQ